LSFTCSFSSPPLPGSTKVSKGEIEDGRPDDRGVQVKEEEEDQEKEGEEEGVPPDTVPGRSLALSPGDHRFRRRVDPVSHAEKEGVEEEDEDEECKMLRDAATVVEEELGCLAAVRVEEGLHDDLVVMGHAEVVAQEGLDGEEGEEGGGDEDLPPGASPAAVRGVTDTPGRRCEEGKHAEGGRFPDWL
jgi:hypothetical protein